MLDDRFRNARIHGVSPGQRARIGALLVAMCGITACAKLPESNNEPLVLVTIGPLEYFVREVAGNSVRVETLLPPGANPHAYEPGIDQLRSLEEAALLVTVGHPGLAFERTIIDRLEPGSLSVVDGFAGVDQGADPHLWLSPQNARILVGNLTNALRDILPDQAEQIQERADSLDTEIALLDKELRSILANVADQSFYVFHDSWGSFARSYDLRQVAIEQEGHEPGPDQVARLIEAARHDSVRSIFIEPQLARQSAELIASEIGAQVVLLDPLAKDWSDNLIRAAHAIADGSKR